MIGRALKGAWGGLRQALMEGGGDWTNLSGGGGVSTTGATSKSGKVVSASSALSLSAAWACVQSNSQLIGSLPLAVYQRDKDGKKVKVQDSFAEMLTISPNAGQTGMEYWESQTMQNMLAGNGYSEKLFVGPRLVGLRPLFNVTPLRRTDGAFNYRINDRGKNYILPPEKVFHTRSFGPGDGLGLSPIKYGVQSFGSALAADEVAGKTFANGLMASGILKSEESLTPEQREQLQAMLNTYVSSERAGKIMTLESGLSYQQLQINPEDAQLLDTRRFGVEDVCRWFGVPPIVVGHAAQGQTMWGSGVEAIMLAWLTLGINPQLRRFETRVLKDLIPREKRGTWFVEWNREAMLQMDSKSKGEFLSKMTTNGIMSRDESRDKLNLPKRGGAADDLTAQTALAPIQNL
ncbi:phage portal protein [Falsihalocynthiibacter arcticus]|uniref:phage portal protein n=1 Tax=Falsihalocynthiibacter arcticus TaxID=1579316 RepID=UPI0030021B25